MAYFFKLVIRNLFRHKLRSILTIVGIVVAIIAFSMLRTIVGAWYAGVEATSSTRLVTRNAVSLVVPLPINYYGRIRQIAGVQAVSYASWFAGIYIDEKNFFPQFAIHPDTYFSLYPEFVVPDAQKADFMRDRKGAIAGAKLVEQYGWKIGDSIPIRGTIYSGNWQFVLRGIYHGAEKKIDETQFFFHWNYLNEVMKKDNPSQADRVGIYLVGVKDADRAAEIGMAIDATFKNSLAETLTETEKAFQLGFVAMTEAILIAIEAVSFVVIVIIMAVMANTMAMTARERKREYATLNALGYSPRFSVLLIFGESLCISVLAGAIGVLMTLPLAGWFAERFGTLFPVFNVSNTTVAFALLAAFAVGFVAACIPGWRVLRLSIIDGLASPG